ncbi:hypothetical protein PCASD_19168 [Puccinia coronata f. sp. avenae]|uniref:Uncharacterized protein n=1 Tax=Puccinia coronata f. sp. avenae TaxID=200324 RepID=A0A2N5TY68_9BASI|nr:hypothetical protein PCASD_19168 [Puccinia coronata f. sp. avenae]
MAYGKRPMACTASKFEGPSSPLRAAHDDTWGTNAPWRCIRIGTGRRTEKGPFGSKAGTMPRTRSYGSTNATGVMLAPETIKDHVSPPPPVTTPATGTSFCH